MAKKTIHYKNTPFEISYELLYPKNTTTIAILHGWGSNKMIMKQAFGSLMQECRHLYIDLPGFGNSTNELILTTQDYKNILELFFKSIQIEPEVIMGHSFGGKVATLLQPKLLVLLSSAGIIEPKPLQVQLKIALFKLLKPFGIVKLRKFFVANDAKKLSKEMYETFKNVVNEDFSSFFSAFNNQALVFWGKNDTATSLESGEKIAKLLHNAPLEIYDGDHYFFLHYPQQIAQRIQEQCKTLNK